MADPGKILALSATTFLLLGLYFNIVPNSPRLPWDIHIDRGPVKIHIPFISGLVISVILTVVFNYFKG